MKPFGELKYKLSVLVPRLKCKALKFIGYSKANVYANIISKVAHAI